MRRPVKQKRLRVTASGTVDARATDVYFMIADYRTGHPRIVPPKYFRNLKVVQGGYGAGTTIEFDMLAMGKMQHARARITEPEPGRVLVETDLDRGAVTTFTVESLGASCRVTIATDLGVAGGPVGLVQRWVFGAYLRRVYAAELAQLRQVMRESAKT